LEEKNIKQSSSINISNSGKWLKFNHSYLISSVRQHEHEFAIDPTYEYSQEIKISDVYSLPYSLLSSYACYFFEPVNNAVVNPFHWRGVIPPFEDLEVIQTSKTNLVVGSSDVYSPTLINYLRDSLGIGNEVTSLSAQDGPILAISKLYPGLRIPKLNENLLDLLISVFCSQHTRIENARSWFIFLKKYYRRTNPIMNMDPYDIMKDSKLICGKSMGYRARYVKEVLSSLHSDDSSHEEKLRQTITQNSIEEARRHLISYKYVGPKTADCFLLNSTGDIHIPPVDVNVKRVFERINPENAFLRLPHTNFCEKYLCNPSGEESCPIYKHTEAIMDGSNTDNGGCLRAAMKIKYENPAVIQASMFLFGLEFCKPQKALCTMCTVDQLCSGIPNNVIKKRRIRVSSKGKKTSYINLIEENVEQEKVILVMAEDLYRKSITSGIQAPKQYLFASTHWIATRNHQVAIPISEVAAAYNVEKNYLFKIISRIKSKLSIKITRLTPGDYVQRFGRKLGLSEEVISVAKHQASTYQTQGRSPIGIAAASLYLATSNMALNISQKMISEVTGISQVTIRKNIKIAKSRAGR